MFIRSKIQFFESKSQRFDFVRYFIVSCLSDQRYNFLKANHNCITMSKATRLVVYQIKDTIFWKQITTYQVMQQEVEQLFIRSKIQFFESKSQRNRETATQGNGCLSDQRYNFLKANHNFCSYKCKENIVVYQIKDTIFWKQITTPILMKVDLLQLFIRSKIQFFESKSQPIVHDGTSWRSCLSDQRYNFLKANHN